MTDVVTIVAFLNLVEYTYTFIKICGKYYTYMEINKKLQYYENAKMIYKLSRDMETKRIKNKKKPIYMGRFGKYLIQVAADISIARLERVADSRERSTVRLYEARKQRKIREEIANEKELFHMGYVKDALSQHYISCDDLLKDIYDSLMVKHPGEKELFDRFIKNVDSESFDEHDFVEVSKFLIYVKVADRLTGLDFNSVLMLEPVYKPASIIWLQAKSMKMYKVDQVVVRHENPCVPE